MCKVLSIEESCFSRSKYKGNDETEENFTADPRDTVHEDCLYKKSIGIKGGVRDFDFPKKRRGKKVS